MTWEAVDHFSGDPGQKEVGIQDIDGFTIFLLQTTLLHFWEKTSHTMAAIHESFKGYQPYEFTTLKV
jgi:hypothetical protein